MRQMLIAATCVAALFLAQRPASATPAAPWCAVISLGTGSSYWDCEYASFEACRPTVLAGNRGWCNLNPAYVGGEPVYPHRRAARHRRHAG